MAGKGTTSPGYINRNRQVVIRATGLDGNHKNQKLYELRCGDCDAAYLANGADIWLRKCPKCQGGQPSSDRSRRGVG